MTESNEYLFVGGPKDIDGRRISVHGLMYMKPMLIPSYPEDRNKIYEEMYRPHRLVDQFGKDFIIYLHESNPSAIELLIKNYQCKNASST